MCTLYFIHRSSIDQFTHTVFFSPRSREKAKLRTSVPYGVCVRGDEVMNE